MGPRPLGWRVWWASFQQLSITLKHTKHTPGAREAGAQEGGREGGREGGLGKQMQSGKERERQMY